MLKVNMLQIPAGRKQQGGQGIVVVADLTDMVGDPGCDDLPVRILRGSRRASGQKAQGGFIGQISLVQKLPAPRFRKI